MSLVLAMPLILHVQTNKHTHTHTHTERDTNQRSWSYPLTWQGWGQQADHEAWLVYVCVYERDCVVEEPAAGDIITDMVVNLTGSDTAA